jgi:hypothetical protein
MSGTAARRCSTTTSPPAPAVETGLHQHPPTPRRALRARLQGRLRHHPRLRPPVPRIRHRPPAVPGPPKARDLASWILTDPSRLGGDEKDKLAGARERGPHLNALAGQVTGFAKILTRPSRRPARRLDHRRRSRRPARPALVRPRCETRPPGRPERPDHALGLRSRRGQRQPAQDDQTTDARDAPPSPAPRARPSLLRPRRDRVETATKYGSDPIFGRQRQASLFRMDHDVPPPGRYGRQPACIGAVPRASADVIAAWRSSCAPSPASNHV